MRFPKIISATPDGLATRYADARRALTLASVTIALWLITLATTGLIGGYLNPVLAQSSCQIDFGILQKKRMGYIATLNKQAKARKGKLDPRRACPTLRRLASAEAEMLKYMKKNKGWCNIPDKPIAQMTQTRARTAKLAGQACRAARTVRRRGPPRGAARVPQRPKLPSGPL